MPDENTTNDGETSTSAPSTPATPVTPLKPAPRRNPLIYLGGLLIVIALLYGATYLLKDSAANSPRAYENTLNKEWGELAEDSKAYVFFLGKIGSAEDIVALSITNAEFKKNVDDKAEIFSRLKESDKYPGLSEKFKSAFIAYQMYLSKVEIIVRNPEGAQVEQDLKELQFLGEDAKKKVIAAEDSAEFLSAELDEKVFEIAQYVGPYTAGSTFGDGPGSE